MTYSMPRVAPLYPPPPFVYESAALAAVVYRVKTASIEDIVPPPLAPSPSGLAACWFLDYPNVPGVGS